MKKNKKLYLKQYPEYIACLAQGCPSCPLLRKGQKYTECPRFEWKQENMNKYGLTVENGRITKVWLESEQQ